WSWPHLLVDCVTESDSNPDVALLHRIAEGDSSALGEFYDLHSRTLFALACRILNDLKEAEDVLQEVFLQLWAKASAFDAHQGRPLAWVLTITRHKAIDRLRATQRRHAHVVEENESTPVAAAGETTASETAPGRDEAELVQRALAQLPAEQ